MPGALTDNEVTEAVRTLDGWEVAGSKLHREFEFADFVEAFGFMSKVAILAEKKFHHPDWSNSWNTVDISITNHEAGGISQQCVDLAAAINDVA